MTGFESESLLIKDSDVRGFNTADAPAITLTTPTGKTLSINLTGDTIDISGDADVTEAAKVFFNEVIKQFIRIT